MLTSEPAAAREERSFLGGDQTKSGCPEMDFVLAGRILPKYLFFVDGTGFMSEEGGNILTLLLLRSLEGGNTSHIRVLLICQYYPHHG